MYINCDVALSNFKQSSPLYVPLFPHHTWSLCRILWRLEAAPEPGPVREQLFEHHQLGLVKQVSHHVLTGQVSLSRLDRFFLKLRCYINLWSIKKITLHVPVYLCFMESVNGISKLTSKSSITDNALFEKLIPWTKWIQTCSVGLVTESKKHSITDCTFFLRSSSSEWAWLASYI